MGTKAVESQSRAMSRSIPGNFLESQEREKVPSLKRDSLSKNPPKRRRERRREEEKEK